MPGRLAESHTPDMTLPLVFVPAAQPPKSQKVSLFIPFRRSISSQHKTMLKSQSKNSGVWISPNPAPGAPRGAGTTHAAGVEQGQRQQQEWHEDDQQQVSGPEKALQPAHLGSAFLLLQTDFLNLSRLPRALFCKWQNLRPRLAPKSGLQS